MRRIVASSLLDLVSNERQQPKDKQVVDILTSKEGVWVFNIEHRKKIKGLAFPTAGNWLRDKAANEVIDQAENLVIPFIRS